jgi:hypothetical protein
MRERRRADRISVLGLARPLVFVHHLGLEYICIGTTASMYTPSDSLVRDSLINEDCIPLARSAAASHASHASHE